MKRGWIWAGQVSLAVLVGVFVYRSLSDHWTEFRGLSFPEEIQPGRIALAALLVWLAYGLLIAGWRILLRGWGQQLSLKTAARIWCLSNLGRYLPGKVWSIAGLAVLAPRAGVAGWAAAASAVAMQALAVGTGVAVVAATSPGAAPPVRLAVAFAIAMGSVFLLTARPLTAAVARATAGRLPVTPLPTSAVVFGAGAALASWFLYGAAFWLITLGFTPATPTTLTMAVGSFTAGYIVGLLALFTPGGLGVREMVLVGLLTPAVGGGPAIVVAVASRLLLTLTEVVAALATLAFGRGHQEMGREPT
jgi:uncharacterized membrane protein YbhN (UPF0104 family)